ncbi:mannosyl-oligosaccharide 1,2-alpha-mannosidase IA-like [Watersipora subatra]|uniref:mannosyl-oligosaccharide 1,2-alpha-mannosidase IA-like n=1 Tax=Watersipora subatra TaxID=2589382 RepID=UPI00355C8614
MILRSPIVRKVTVAAVITIFLISLLQYYKYNSQLKYKPSQEYLSRLTEARKADSKSTQRKDSGLSQGNLKKSHSPAASSLPHHEQPLRPKVGTSLSGGAVSNRSVPLHSSFLEKSAGIIKNANGPPLLRAQGGDSEGKVNTGLKENIESKEQQTEQGQDGRSLGEERAEDQHDDVTSEFKILHSLNSGGKCKFGRNLAREQEWKNKDEKTSQKSTHASLTRAEYVKEMMRHAWSNYRKFAWGANELAPQVQRPHDSIFPSTRLGLTIVDSLDTLWIMGMFEEVEHGKQWLVQNLTTALHVNAEVSVFEFNIRFVGGLLAMYALTNECEYKQLAIKCADKLLPAFNTTSGIPISHVNLKHGIHGLVDPAGEAVLSEIGTLHLEFVYLSYISGNPTYRQLVEKLREKIIKANVNGLYSNTINIARASFNQYDMTVSMGGMGDSFYEYLFKSFLQSGGTNISAKDQYFAAMKAIMDAGLLKQSHSGLRYFGTLSVSGGKTVYDKMEHLACFTGGLMALSAKYSVNRTWTLEVAEDIGKTCHESYNRSESKLGPESFYFTMGREAMAIHSEGDPTYHLRPETVETWFFLDRVTGKKIYKDWAWDVVQALEAYCKLPHGYAGLINVYLSKLDQSNKPLVEDIQQSFFLAETLKYLYLIYKDDGLLPLSDWVFNTEAHPLPVLHPASP